MALTQMQVSTSYNSMIESSKKRKRELFAKSKSIRWHSHECISRQK